jgi:uncharacterized membrane-anchored protein YitT (DUF2179 family)
MGKILNFLKQKTVTNHIKNWVLVFLGNFVLAFGNAVFMTELKIVAGGLTGVGIILEHFFGNITIFGAEINIISIVVFVLTWGLWLVGLFFLSKEFAIKTLLSSILYPIFLFLFLQIPFIQDFAKEIANTAGALTQEQLTAALNDTGRILLCGVFSGVCVGAGCALTFVGGGSTGGVDIIALMLEKYAHIKTSLSLLIIDGTIVLVGMLCIRNYTASLCGIIAAALSALMVEVIESNSQSCYIAEIISSKWEEINDYVKSKLDRGSTIIEVKGGYQGEPRKILRIVFDKNQFNKVRAFVAEIDPNAFITYTKTNAVFGEGFKSHNSKTRVKKSAKHE